MSYQPTPTIPHPTVAPARVLIADDDPTMCAVCARALAAAGHQSFTAVEADAALEALREHGPFDLLLADVQMPGVSGLELAQRAREIDPALAVVIMTGHTSMETLHGAARRGVADYLSKPFELEELQIVVDQALHKRHLLQDQLRMRALEQLMRSSEAINALLDREQLAHEIVARARAHLPCRAGFLIVGGSGALRPEVVVEPAGAGLLPAGYEAVALATSAGRAVAVDGRGPLAQADGLELLRGVAVPLRSRAETVGALLLCDEHADFGSPGALEIVGLLANQAGNALRNAQLYGELEETNQGLRELDRMKSEFIAITSHELRSPLSIVMGYAKMVRDRSEGEQRDYSQRVLEGAERIKSIVDDMMRLREFDRKQAQLHMEPRRLDELLREAVDHAGPAALQKQQTIELALPEAPIVAPLDREKLLLVLANLLANAVKFTPVGGRVRVELADWSYEALSEAVGRAAANPSLRRLAGGPAPRWAVIRVSDTGIGVPRDEQGRIFERFYQVASSLTREQGGVGLGLAIACDLTTLQGGVVWVESEPGQGSCFSLALPAAA